MPDLAERVPCPFCTRLANGHFDAGDRWAVTFEPLHPHAPGHRLFIPRIHVTDALAHPEIAGQTMRYAATWAAARSLGPCNLITSAGAPATQTVFHLHVHLIPRGTGDGLTRSWPWTGRRRS